MQLQESVKNVLAQLAGSLSSLTEAEYTQPSKLLFNATIGQHVRHIVELFVCLEEGYERGIINYESRKRDRVVERDKTVANQLLLKIYHNINKSNKSLLLEMTIDETSKEVIMVSTNYYREIIYNLEHTVHHMALIRVGINDVSQVVVDDDFGVASSTIRYRQSKQP